MAAESEDSRKLKLLVFGGTGGTGKEVVTQALQRGHLVTAVVRTPEKVDKRYVESGNHLVIEDRQLDQCRLLILINCNNFYLVR